MKFKALRGMNDILPDEIGLWQRIEEAARKIFGSFGYSEIRTPAMESTQVFTRSIGEATDIVQKEMYSFKDRGKRDISLRPEGTAPIVRAYIEHGLQVKAGFGKFYYIGPMFRAERPQAGRQRQFHQVGVEAIGSYNPYLDAEVIGLMKSFFDEIGLKGFKIKINSLGCKKDKADFNKLLKKELKADVKALCEDCKLRYEKNILRIFDCKNPNCKSIVRRLPSILDHLCEECAGHFDKVKEGLDLIGVEYEVDPRIVRGLDYYTRTAFEVTHSALGAQDAIGAGGRYDNLVKDFDGPEMGACGFALGTERIITALGEGAEKAASGLDVYVATIGEAAYKKGFEIVADLRKNGLATDLDYEEKSLKGQLRRADKCGVRFVVIIGEDEINKGKAAVRDMKTKQQKEVEFGDLVNSLK